MLNSKRIRSALEYADKAVVFYSPDAVKIKQLEEVTYDQIANALIERFDYLYESKDFKDYLFNLNLDNSAIVDEFR
jgi:UDP-N-acetylmuramate: L-alanyl-gamma-D-glutamyl-meso-diaminopimelate ligase